MQLYYLKTFFFITEKFIKRTKETKKKEAQTQGNLEIHVAMTHNSNITTD